MPETPPIGADLQYDYKCSQSAERFLNENERADVGNFDRAQER
jgi:hypothetical protein